MQFGKSLARLATEIAAGYGERNENAVARAATLSALNATTRKTLSTNAAHRAVVASDLAATAADLRQRLAAGDAALGVAVQNSLDAARKDLLAKRQTIAANARALRSSLTASRRSASAALNAFRGEVRGEQAAAATAQAASLAKFAADLQAGTAGFLGAARADQAASATALANSLDKFVAGVRSETASIKAEVQDQFRIARAAWGHATAPVATPAVPSAAKAPAPAAPVQTRPATPAEAAPAEPAATPPVRHRKRDAEKAAGEDEQNFGMTRSTGSLN